MARGNTEREKSWRRDMLYRYMAVRYSQHEKIKFNNRWLNYQRCLTCLEGTEALLAGNYTLRFMGHNIESDRLAQRAALSDGDDITLLDRECGRAMHRNIGVTLLETAVFGDVVKVVPSDDNRSLHLGRDDATLEDSAANGDVSSERALLVYIVTFNGGSRGLDAETHVLDEAHRLVLVGNGAFASDEDRILLLVSLFVLVALDVFSGNARHGLTS